MNINEASTHLGIPVAQLKSWAAQRAVGFNQSGPAYIGHWRKPEYNQQDLDEWKENKIRAILSATSSANALIGEITDKFSKGNRGGGEADPY